MRLKAGVSLKGVQWEMFLAAILAEAVYQDMGVELVITSGVDGKHGKGSFHYKGLALDFRTRDVPKAQRPRLRDKVKKALGEDYDVVLEADHLHVEYDP